MRTIFTLSLVFVVLATLLFVQHANASNTVNIGANVIVQSACPFAISMNVLPTYSKALNTVTANYFIFTLNNACSLNGMPGFVNITHTNTVTINSLPANSGTLTNTPTEFSFNIPLSSLSNTAYDANVAFSGSIASNFSASEFQVLSPQNVILTNFAGSSEISPGAAQSFSFTLSNDGQLASGPITVNLVITGPANSVTSAAESSLSPGQSTNDILSLADGGNTIFFGLNVPTGQSPEAYNQLVTIEGSC